MQQRDSTGELGWPVAVKDRIAFAVGKSVPFSESNVAVVFYWTMRDAVLPKLEKNNLAMACNFYTPAGLAGMIRNIAANPYIRYVISFGMESIDGKDQLTSAGALKSFFQHGITAERKIEGFESAVYFDQHIPTEIIQRVRDSVEFIDLNAQMPNASLQEKISKANELLQSLPKKEPFLEKPLTFDFDKTVDSFPYAGGPITVVNSTIPRVWIDMIRSIYRYGKKNLMNANTDRWVKEVNNMVCVVKDPQNLDLSINPFLVPLNEDKIRAYQSEVLSSLLPAGKAYTYGNKLRAYHYPSKLHVKEMVESDQYKDWEFGKGNHLEQNVHFDGDRVEINQIADIIEVLKRDPYSKACVAVTWHPVEELMRKHKSSPCLVYLQAMVQDEKLNLTVFFRSHDMVQGWPENTYGMAAIQKEIAESIGLPCGIMTLISGSAQIYNHYYKQVEEMLGKFNQFTTDYRDPMGNYIVKLKGDKIVVEHWHPVTNMEMESFEGKTARDVYWQISLKTKLEPSHAMYLGAELQKAELALQHHILYEQDKPLKF